MGVNVSKLQFIKLKQVEKELGTLAAMYELEIMKDGFRYSNSAIIRATADKHNIEVVPAHWEFIPPWIKTMEEVKEARKKFTTLNATAEKLLESKMYREAALKRRCLVLASHFYEWRHYKPEGEKKELAYPYVVQLKDADYFFMAGLWQTWTDRSSGETMDCFTIVTTEANEFMQQVHNKKKRMPVMLPEDLAWEWIMDELPEERIKQIAAYQINPLRMHAYTIQKNFKRAENPLEAFTYPELPELQVPS